MFGLVQRLTGRPLTSRFIGGKTVASHALRPKLAAGLAVGVAAAHAFSTPTAGCVPATRASNPAAAAAAPQPHTVGQAAADATHGIQCPVCQDYFGTGGVIGTTVCDHKICTFCFESVDSRACVVCREEWPEETWSRRGVTPPPHTRNTSNDEVGLVAGARGSPPPLGGWVSSDEEQQTQVLVPETSSDEDEPEDERSNILYGVASPFGIADGLRIPVLLQITGYVRRENATAMYTPGVRVDILDGTEARYDSSDSTRSCGLISRATRIPMDIVYLDGNVGQLAWALQAYSFGLMVDGKAFSYGITYNTSPGSVDEFGLTQYNPVSDPRFFPAGLRHLARNVALNNPRANAKLATPGTIEYEALLRQNERDHDRAKATLDAAMRAYDEDRGEADLRQDHHDTRRVRRRLNGGPDGN